MSREMRICWCLILLASIYSFGTAAVISIDLGTESMKIGIVSPGMPLEVALNKESKRKTPVAIAFRNGERTFGEDALTVGVRFPKNCYTHLTDLLGKTVDHPSVKRYQEMFPYHEIVPHAERQTVMFKHESGELFTVEELVGQIVAKARDYAEMFSQQVPIREAVITVPPYFDQAERRAMMKAAAIGELKVLQLVNTNAAIGLNFGIFRSKEWNDTARYFLFYDMGASSTVATVIAYQTAKTKERGYSETNPQLAVVGVGFDRTLGGSEIQRRLQLHLANAFNEMKKTENDVTKNPRAFAKLFKEAGRVKNVLSANADHYAQIEGLLDEKDFKYLVTRTQLEELSADLLDRLQGPLLQALETSGLTLDRIEQIILVGGNTRMPAVQARLIEITGRELSKNINADEACALGAVYRAADLSTGFKVKKFVIKDSIFVPIEVDFERQVEEEKKGKVVKRTLYSFMNPYPQKKILTFNKHTEDFEFYVNYAPTEQMKLSPPILNISVVKLDGVKRSIEKNSESGAEFKGIKVHFHIDESGILNLNSVESTFEKLNPDNVTGNATSPENPEANTTNVNSTNGSNSTAAKKEKKTEAITIKEEIAFVESYLDLPDFTPQTFDVIMDRVRKINEADKIKKEKEQAFNLLESYVLDMQNKIYEDEHALVSTDEEKEAIRTKCSEVAIWLDEDGFEASTDTLRQKLLDVKEITKDVEFRAAEMKNRDQAVSVLVQALNVSSNFVERLRNASSEERYLEEDDFNSFFALINRTEAWLNDTMSILKSQAPTENPSFTTLAFLDKANDLERELRILTTRMQANRARKMREVVEKIRIKNETSSGKGKFKKMNETEEKTEQEPEKTEDESQRRKNEAEEELKTDQNEANDKDSDNEHLEL
uniref:Hypoxia up-regulated protein 1 n=1 Tax=Artemia sinica TaxID=112780 RepID=A0A0F7CSW1_9CRUS|nr:hypoxia up-regulated protein [Artemia sinica]